MLEVQQTAPSFSVADDRGFVVHLEDYQTIKKNLVLYFYPKDDTTGCTIEANQFTQHISKFTELDTVIYGVSKDDSASHKAFVEKYDLQVGLLADTDGKMCEDYGVWQEKEKDGEKTMGIVRSTFIIDKKGVIKYVEYGVNPDGHALDVLEKVKQL